MLKKKILDEMILDDSIKDVGGGKSTTISDLLIYRYNVMFEEDVEVSATEIFIHGEKALNLKLHGQLQSSLVENSMNSTCEYCLQ